MKVREIVNQLKYENPESEVLPISDDNGKFAITVLLPTHQFGEPLTENRDAKTALAGHVSRIENIRMVIATFFGLSVKSNIHLSKLAEWVELVVKSPTDKTIATIEITVGYVLQKDDGAWYRHHQGSSSDIPLRFSEVSPELAGYRCHVNKYVITGNALTEALKIHCEAPKCIELEQ